MMRFIDVFEVSPDAQTWWMESRIRTEYPEGMPTEGWSIEEVEVTLQEGSEAGDVLILSRRWGPTRITSKEEVYGYRLHGDDRESPLWKSGKRIPVGIRQIGPQLDPNLKLVVKVIYRHESTVEPEPVPLPTEKLLDTVILNT